jgi:Clr5 domain
MELQIRTAVEGTRSSSPLAMQQSTLEDLPVQHQQSGDGLPDNHARATAQNEGYPSMVPEQNSQAPFTTVPESSLVSRMNSNPSYEVDLPAVSRNAESSDFSHEKVNSTMNYASVSENATSDTATRINQINERLTQLQPMVKASIDMTQHWSTLSVGKKLPWETYRAEIVDCRVRQRMSVLDFMELMESKYNFRATYGHLPFQVVANVSQSTTTENPTPTMGWAQHDPDRRRPDIALVELRATKEQEVETGCV